MRFVPGMKATFPNRDPVLLIYQQKEKQGKAMGFHSFFVHVFIMRIICFSAIEELDNFPFCLGIKQVIAGVIPFRINRCVESSIGSIILD